MAKAPSKKSAKTAKAAASTAEGKKKKRKTARVETYSSYIHKVLKQVHPGECCNRQGRPAAIQHALTLRILLRPLLQKSASARRPCP
jgi:hypothetical protein